jgi:hypothetical protein
MPYYSNQLIVIKYRFDRSFIYDVKVEYLLHVPIMKLLQKIENLI